jgi:TPR repeat protein
MHSAVRQSQAHDPGDGVFWMGETWVGLADSIRELRRDFQLGCLMMETQDFKGAEHWWRIANDLGEPKARPLEIAEMLWHRNFPAEARSWFERAAQEGSQWGASRLGDLLDSQGDHAEADYWRCIAAELLAEESQPKAEGNNPKQ